MRCPDGLRISSAFRPCLVPPSVVALFLVAGAAAGGAPPVAPPVAPPKPVEFRMADSSVIVSDVSGNELVIRHAPGSHLVPRNQKLPRAGGFVFYGHSCYLMVVKADVTDAAQAIVVGRIVYPGPIQSVATNEGGFPVTVLAGGGDAEPRRYYYPPKPDEPHPTVFPLDEEAFAAPMADALKLVPGLRRDGTISEDEREGAKGRVKLLWSAFAANPTNPWYKLYEGVVRRSDDYAEARRAFRAAVDVRGAPAFDYLRMSALLASMGEMAASDVAFDRGYSKFVEDGLEPELLMSREALERIYALPLDGPPEGPGTAHAVAMAKAREAGDTETMVSLAERIWRLAPRCEGVALTFAGLAEHLQGEGRKDSADVWRERVKSASRFAGPVGGRHVFYAGASCLVALLVLLAICFMKARPRQKKDLAPLGGWLGSWRWTWERFSKMAFAYATRKELVGIFLVAAAGLALSYTAIRAESSVFRAAKLPEALKVGTWAHPDAVSYLDDLRTDPGRPANKLLYAIALQQEARNRIDEDVYEGLGGGDRLEAVAENNSGVALWESTEPVKAGARFRKARGLDPGLAEASYNDEDKEEGGGQVGSVRTSRARRYLRNRKIIALPDADMLAVAFAGTEAQDEGAARAGGLGMLKPLAWLTLVLTAVVAVLVLPFLVIRRKALPERRWGMLAGIGYVFPGTSARLAPTGGILLAAWVYCLIVLVLVVQGDAAGGVDEVGRIVEGTFGITGNIVFPFESVMMIFGPAAFVGLWVLNGVLLARATRLAKAMARAAAPPPETGAPPGGAAEEGPSEEEASDEEPSAEEASVEKPSDEEPSDEEPAAEDEEAEAETSAGAAERQPPSEEPPSTAAPAETSAAPSKEPPEKPSPKPSPKKTPPPATPAERPVEGKPVQVSPAPEKAPAPKAETAKPKADKPAEKPKAAESSREKPTEEKPAEEKPAEKKPAAEKPVQEKPKVNPEAAKDDKPVKPEKDATPDKAAKPDKNEKAATPDEDEDDYQPPL